MLKINEIFYSIQGESSHAGKPCVFIRLTFCNLRCVWCDTEYSFYEGIDITIDDIIKQVAKFNCDLVEVTGGEPLMQEESIPLMEKLLESGYRVMLETSGSIDMGEVPKAVIKIVDFKCPSSKMAKKNLWDNVKYIGPQDEVKFVIGNREDFDWSKKIVEKYQLDKKATVLLSPVFNGIDNQTLANWILNEHINARLQIQLHKYIWSPDTRGV